ncbi:phosphoglycerate dehydrogenase [Staphylococcus gallinarum]|jgi:D-3-phosphoglycerate dehydrogenase|uniref:D-3-phosphoglycerate dehydrogenase n=4 Tax=Staphylococcus gallinarum TaxID=1293 RepID=A0A0D0SR26_STAGA|nr:phosphoglycerate dehydrogenase [Staphylococcus gallinarum]KIR11609.1 D-3-phosphoglycerate dehydrogenase [Staphylococcus gallinarum]MCD8786928.1 phosphoglycerate dehydrogenase [Staphylococcus gallinarum]MCD8819889.1 phosphoglycerate dehydrogenase [Staphylococcus gallinarum]MCD8826128.1 phosphoglycerate dehydrogenase [Staphylococcus gallinarum]MCD8827929.1 phosphoglycerate dehydrogenase [Staphylococcus gallinarum]
MYKILVSDPISPEGLKSLTDHKDFEVVTNTELSESELIEKIADFEGLIVRSQTQVTADVIAAAPNLKVIARAGVGVDNIDIDAATKHGVIVINAPDGNTISATEHSMAMILSMARNVPQAHKSLKEGKWDRKTYRGTELYNKVLGVVGAGRIGLGVAKRAQSFGMKILAFDPYLSEDKAKELNVIRATVDEIAEQADFVTVHTPLTPKTKGIVGEAFFAKAKPTLQIINVARGGIIDEEALLNALNEDRIQAAALDVFETEPATESPLVKHDKVVVTPHLGASTVEAQEKVAVSVANEIVDIFENGNVLNAINAPRMTYNEINEELKPYIELSKLTGEVGIQLLEKAPRELHIKYEGDLALDDTSLITRTLVSGVLRQDLGERVNLINALVLLNEQGVSYNIEKNTKHRGFSNYIELTLINKDTQIKIGATVLNGYGPRIVRINDYPVDFKPEQHQLVINHTDKPGIVGRTGQILGEFDINIASMHLGRTNLGGNALMVLSIDHPVNQDVIDALFQIEGFNNVRSVELDIPQDTNYNI